jgi:hypothetical protein
MLVKLDVAGSTIIIKEPEGREATPEKTFTLAKDVEVGIGDGTGRRTFLKEGKLTELATGTMVTLVLSADQKVVEGILAEGPTLRGLLKSIDVGGKTLSVSVMPGRRDEEGQERTLAVADDAEIAVDDGRGRRSSLQEAKIADLVPGSLVTVRLSIDQKQVVAVVAEGPNLFGTLKAVDAGKHLLTVATPPGRGDETGEEKSLTLATGALVIVDDGRGKLLSQKAVKLAEVPVGAAVSVKLSPDQKFVTMLRAEGPSMPGLIKAINATDGTITVVTGARRDDSVEKTLPVAKDARIIIEGTETKLADVKLGDEGLIAMLRLTLDQKSVQTILVGRGR